jgi:soluble lytic murein transglycosylase-like protein
MIQGSMRRLLLGYSLLVPLVLAALPIGAEAGGYRSGPPRVSAFDQIIQSTAHDFGVEPALVKAVIAAESAFDSEAVSRMGAIGLMQLMPDTAAELGVEDPMNPVQNIEGGTRYLREMLDRYGDMRRALAAYNAGPDAVDRYQGVPPYRETRVYVSRVLDFYRGYRNESRPGKRRATARRRGRGEPLRPEAAGIEMIRGTTRSN